MITRNSFAMGALALSHALPWAAAQGNLVVNGGFDSDASGWTTNASSGYYEALKGHPGGCFTLSSSISQNIAGLIPGSRYVISGSYDIEGGSVEITPSFGVAINGTFLFEAAPRDYYWHDFTFSYTATASNAVLSLAAQINGTSDVYRVDNVVIQPAPVVTLRAVGTNVIVSWPTNTLGFNLQSATNLNAASWVAVTNTPTIVGTNYSLAFGAIRRVQFFSLRR